MEVPTDPQREKMLIKLKRFVFWLSPSEQFSGQKYELLWAEDLQKQTEISVLHNITRKLKPIFLGTVVDTKPDAVLFLRDELQVKSPLFELRVEPEIPLLRFTTKREWNEMETDHIFEIVPDFIGFFQGIGVERGRFLGIYEGIGAVSTYTKGGVPMVEHCHISKVMGPTDQWIEYYVKKFSLV